MIKIGNTPRWHRLVCVRSKSHELLVVPNKDKTGVTAYLSKDKRFTVRSAHHFHDNFYLSSQSSVIIVYSFNNGFDMVDCVIQNTNWSRLVLMNLLVKFANIVGYYVNIKSPICLKPTRHFLWVNNVLAYLPDIEPQSFVSLDFDDVNVEPTTTWSCQ